VDALKPASVAATWSVSACEVGCHVQRVGKALGRRDEVDASWFLDGLIASAPCHSRRSRDAMRRDP
jgi:hypothetical protein